MKLLEPFYLTYLAIKVKLHSFFMYLSDKRKYYKKSEFKTVDQALLKAYRFKNPYTICKRHMQSMGATDCDVYGETPLDVYEKIIQLTGLKERDYFVELGFGRGRGLLFTHAFSKCHCLGIEFVDKFCNIAKRIVSDYDLRNVSIKKKNFLRCDLSDADVIYLCSTLMSEQEILRFISQAQKGKKHLKIITTSFPLEDYSHGFQIVHEFEARFLWGKTTVYVNALA